MNLKDYLTPFTLFIFFWHLISWLDVRVPKSILRSHPNCKTKDKKMQNGLNWDIFISSRKDTAAILGATICHTFCAYFWCIGKKTGYLPGVLFSGTLDWHRSAMISLIFHLNILLVIWMGRISIWIGQAYPIKTSSVLKLNFQFLKK